MANIQKSIALKNCTIDMSDMTATEVKKDGTTTYDLKKILTEFAGVDGVSITISRSDIAQEFESEDGVSQ